VSVVQQASRLTDEVVLVSDGLALLFNGLVLIIAAVVRIGADWC